jgi:hypothetical protein
VLQRQKQPLLSSELEAWRAEFLRAKGWKGKVEAQEAAQLEMVAACQRMEQSVLPDDPQVNPYAHAALDPKALSAGKEFRAFLKALKDFEEYPPPRSPKVLAALGETAQGYLDHFAEHSKKQQRDPNNITKADACRAALAGLRQYENRDELVSLVSWPRWRTRSRARRPVS